MLKRIHELRNVGRFRNCRAGGVEFSRLTIIYGRNTYGKSTLGDAFASIATGDTSLITGRRSIPTDLEPQRIRFSVQIPDQTGETDVRYEEDAWVVPLPPSLGVKTFDDGFLHKNLFAARAFTRTTKENFSAYVLGERGVQQAKEIAEKKRIRQQLTRDRNTLERDAFSRVDDIPAFVELTPTGTKDEAEEALHALGEDRSALRKQLRDIDLIRARPEGNPLTWMNNFTQSVVAINDTLPVGLEGTHDAAKARVTQHIADLFREPQGAEQWIREGLRQNQGDACQFCGQELSQDARTLLDSYRQAFDAEFDRHEQTVKARLEGALRSLATPRTDQIRALLGQNAAALAQYPELVGRREFEESRGHHDRIATELDEMLARWDQVSGAARDSIEAAIAQKLQSPHHSMPGVDEREVMALETHLGERITEYNEALDDCARQLRDFKQSSNPQAIQARMAKLNMAIGEAESNLLRITLHDQCVRHKRMTEETAGLNTEIPQLEEQLRLEQSEYLQRFFEALNRWFTAFGSRDFTLERADDARGHTPIYFLRVRYHGVDIDERSLDKVFSESDRRALALAVFWSQLQELPDAEKNKQIVVLDDPITSFDDSRVTAVHRELVAALDQVRQVIVLSHYSHEIRSFFETYRDLPGVHLLCLESSPAGTQIVASHPEEFIRSEHEKARVKLTEFSNGTINVCELGSLRVFFEQELRYRFAAQIASQHLGRAQLSETIDGLAENRTISDETRRRCHEWRTTLNPAHHIWPNEDLEDRRNTTRAFLEFVYHDLVPL